MPNHWTYEQKFNDLILGDLNGQDSWTGSSDYQVVTTSPYEGTKCLKNTGNGEDATRTFTAVDYGTVYVSMKSEDIVGNGGGDWLLKDDVPQFCLSIYFKGNYDIIVHDYPTATDHIIGTWTANTWYRIGVAFDYTAGGWEGLSQNHFKVNINNGAWSSAYGLRAGGTKIISMLLYITGRDIQYWDYISPYYTNIWTYEQTFNTLNDGALNGQDSWTATAGFDVETSVKYEGAKALQMIHNGVMQEATRVFSNIVSGSFYIAIRKTDNNADIAQLCLNTNDGVNVGITFQLSDTGKIQYYASGYVDVTTYNANQWYVLNIEFDYPNQTTKGRVRVHDGSSWGSFTDWFTPGQYNWNHIDSIYLTKQTGSGNTTYYDYISPNYPPPSTTNIKSVSGVAYANISKVSGVTKANISKIAGLQ